MAARPDAANGDPALSRFISAASFVQPDFLVDSAWHGHAPFAFWLVSAMRPCLTVELGVEAGFSYFVLCQALESSQGRCVGIDTWEGDEHSGSYGEEVYESVASRNCPYARHSTLVRATFEAALPDFEVGSIDLLHIDGCHHYEAVRRDFESWQEKLSSSAVVLFHDTSERLSGFGVWRLWEELTALYPSFEFVHGHGLGVLAHGASVATPVAELCALDPVGEVAAEVRRVYRELGDHVSDRIKIVKLEEGWRSSALEVSDLTSRVADLESNVSDLESNVAEREDRVIQASLLAYTRQWERDVLSARLADARGVISVSPTVLRAARSASAFLSTHPRTLQGLRKLSNVRNRWNRAPDAHDYQAWIERFDSTPTRELDTAAAERMSHRPRFSVLMPVCDPPLAFLDAAIDSLRSQHYPDWELIVVDDASVEPEIVQRLADLTYPRTTVVRNDQRRGISETLNRALGHATADYVAFLDHDDVLTSDALLIVAEELMRHAGVAFVYSDEDLLDLGGSQVDPYFKPDWNPSLVLGQNFVGHLLVCRTDLVRSLGGFRRAFDGAQDWDLVLRMAERAEENQIVHIPHVLYHWRRHSGSASTGIAAKPYVVSAGRRAVEEALQRRGVRASVESLPNGWNRVSYELPPDLPAVEVVVPSGLAHPFVALCLECVLNRTDYPDLRLTVVVDDAALKTRSARLPASVRNDPRVRIISYEATDGFNFSRAVNLGVSETEADMLCLMNDDVIAVEPLWLSALVARAAQPGVGAVGPLLSFPDETIQHGGVILGVGDVARHYHEGVPVGAPGYCGRALLDQDLSGVTAACMVVHREIFESLAGFDETFAVSFNDVDFCLRLRAAGWRIVWTPESRLYHTESTSVRQIPGRVPQYQDEVRRMHERWDGVLQADPFYSPNLSLSAMNGLAWPPRVARPHRAVG
jgi:GT2 family glycosyltransferase